MEDLRKIFFLKRGIHLIAGIFVVIFCIEGFAQDTGRVLGIEVRTPYDELIDTPKVLAATFYQDLEHINQLTMYMQAIPYKGNTAFEKYNLPIVLMLVKSIPNQSTIGKIHLITYQNISKDMAPLVRWSAAIAKPADKDEIYVVTAESRGGNITLRLYKVDRGSTIGMYPLQLDWDQYKKWPKPSIPISEIKTSLEGVCGISRIEILSEQTHLLIYCEREDEHCPGVYFRFNLQTRKWAKVTIQEENELGSEGKIDK